MRWILDACTLIYLIKTKLFNKFMELADNEVVIDSSVFQEAVIDGKANKYHDAFEAEEILNTNRVPVISIDISEDLYRFIDAGETSCYLLAKEDGICLTSDDRAYRKFINEHLNAMRLDTFFYEKFNNNRLSKSDFLRILSKLELVNASKPKSILFFMKKLQEREENKN